MFNVHWDNKYEIGHERIDFEHKIFLGLIQDIADEVSTHRDLARIQRLQREVVKYAEFHFLSEENIMEEVGYPELEFHRKLHLDLMSSIANFAHDLAVGKASYEDFVSFLFEWFALHTSNEDKKIAAFIAQQPA